MTDHTLALRTLLRAISDLSEDTPVHADTVREAFDAAGLNSAERSGAFKAAATAGYLVAPHKHLPNGQIAVYHVQSTAESRKGAWSMLWARTALPVPEHVCGPDFVVSQQDSWDDGDSKTAPAGNRGLTTQTVKES